MQSNRLDYQSIHLQPWLDPLISSCHCNAIYIPERNALISYKSVTNIHPPLYPPHGPPLYHFFSGSNMAR
jgi:hypothetical protein